MANRSGLIYKLTSPNGKVYIGQTIDLSARLSRYKNYTTFSGRKQPKLFNSIKKYGWENFQVEILEKDLLENFLDKKEVGYIKEYDSFLGESGLNCTVGGNSLRGKDHPFFGKKHSEKTKNKIAASRKGQRPSEESRLKMSKARLGKKQPNISKANTGKKRPNISKAQLGKKRKPFSEEHLNNMRNAQRTRRQKERALEI